MSEEELEIREEARRFILAAAEAAEEEGRDPMETLDELATFFDGDICDLF